MNPPPLPWLVAYRLLGLRLPPEYRGWVAADAAKKSFLNWRSARTVVWGAVFVGLGCVAITLVHEAPPRHWVLRALAAVTIAALLASRNNLVRRTLRWQRIDKHGRPVRPKRLAVLDNNHALVLGAAVLVAFTGGAAVFGHGLRPTGVEAIPCRPPDAETLALLNAGLKSKDTKLIDPQSIPFGTDAQIVVAVVDKPGDDRNAAGFWIVDGGTVYEIRQPDGAAQSPTTFDPPPSPDRVAVEALQRAVTCLTRSRAR